MTIEEGALFLNMNLVETKSFVTIFCYIKLTLRMNSIVFVGIFIFLKTKSKNEHFILKRQDNMEYFIYLYAPIHLHSIYSKYSYIAIAYFLDFFIFYFL